MRPAVPVGDANAVGEGRAAADGGLPQTGSIERPHRMLFGGLGKQDDAGLGCLGEEGADGGRVSGPLVGAEDRERVAVLASDERVDDVGVDHGLTSCSSKATANRPSTAPIDSAGPSGRGWVSTRSPVKRSR